MATQYEKRKQKVKEKTEGASQEVVSPPEPNWTGEAFDVFFDEERKKFVRVKVQYDKDSGRAEVVALEDIADNQPVAIKKMTEIFSRKVLRLPIV